MHAVERVMPMIESGRLPAHARNGLVDTLGSIGRQLKEVHLTLSGAVSSVAKADHSGASALDVARRAPGGEDMLLATIGASDLIGQVDALSGAVKATRGSRSMLMPWRAPGFDLAGHLPALEDLHRGLGHLRARIDRIPQTRLYSGAAIANSTHPIPAQEVARAAASHPYLSVDHKPAQAMARRVFDWIGVEQVVRGTEHIPAGPVIFAPMHGSNADAIFLVNGIPDIRTIRFMANHKLLTLPGIGPVLTKLGGIPVRFGDSAESISIARGALHQGESVAMYPEGRFVYGDHIGEAKTGVARLAIAENVPIVPVATSGTKPRWTQVGHNRRAKPVIMFGRPIKPTSVPGANHTAQVEALTEKLARDLSDLHERARAIRLSPGPSDLRTGMSMKRRVQIAAGAGVAGAGAALYGFHERYGAPSFAAHAAEASVTNGSGTP